MASEQSRTSTSDDGPHLCGWCGETYEGGVCECVWERGNDV